MPALTDDSHQARITPEGRLMVDIGDATIDLGEVEAVPATAATATVTEVGISDTSVLGLAANPARRGGTIYNDSDQHLYVKFGADATLTDFTAALHRDVDGIGGYMEIPFGYTGRIDLIWAAAGTGAARITELEA